MLKKGKAMIKLYPINGSGGSGKDKFIEYVETILDNRNSKIIVINHSTVDSVKDAIEILGWDRSDKSDEAREFMSVVNDARKKYNNGPVAETIDLVKTIIEDSYEFHDFFIFCHCREPENIIEIKEKGMEYCEVKTILLERYNHIPPTCSKDDPNIIKSINYDIYYKANTKEDLMNLAIDFVEREKF